MACRSTDPAFFADDGRPIANLPCALFKIGVAPVAGPSGDVAVREAAARAEKADPPEQPPIPFDYRPAEERDKIIATLARLNAASKLEKLENAERDAALREAFDKGCDLLVLPRRTDLPIMRYAHVSDRHLLSGGLWFTTLVGGWFVEDATYETRARIEFDIYATESQMKIDTVTAESEYSDLAFWDRNSPLSVGGLQSLFLPPFWTADDDEDLKTALFERTYARLAAQLTGYLKQKLPELERSERSLIGEVVVRQPRSGADVAGSVQIVGEIFAPQRIDGLQIYVGDGAGEKVTIDSGRDQRRGTRYGTSFRHAVRIEAGVETEVKLEVDIRGDLTTRTLLVNPKKDT